MINRQENDAFSVGDLLLSMTQHFCSSIDVLNSDFFLSHYFLISRFLHLSIADIHNIRPAGQILFILLVSLIKTPFECVKTYQIWPLDMSKKTFVPAMRFEFCTPGLLLSNYIFLSILYYFVQHSLARFPSHWLPHY